MIERLLAFVIFVGLLVLLVAWMLGRDAGETD